MALNWLEFGIIWQVKFPTTRSGIAVGVPFVYSKPGSQDKGLRKDKR